MKRKDFLKGLLVIGLVPLLPRTKKVKHNEKWEFPMPNFGATKCPKCRKISMFVCRMSSPGEKLGGVDFNWINCGYYEYHKQQNAYYFPSMRRKNWSIKENGYAYINGRVVTWRDFRSGNE